MATLHSQIQPEPKIQTGMTDPYINETVTYVAELDEEAIRKEMWYPFLCCFVFGLCMGILCPMFCIIQWIMFCCVKKQIKSTVEGTHLYVTEHTLVYVKGGLPIEFSRMTIPLANIASVSVQPPDMLINIKPTAPEVILSRPGYHRGGTGDTGTFATRTVPIPHLKNAETFAEVIHEVITK